MKTWAFIKSTVLDLFRLEQVYLSCITLFHLFLTEEMPWLQLLNLTVVLMPQANPRRNISIKNAGDVLFMTSFAVKTFFILIQFQ